VVALHRLHYLIAVADSGSFSSAASELRVAQSALSRQISLLEQELGVSLLVRSSRGAEVTPAGSVLVERGRTLLAELDRAVAETVETGRGGKGQVTLGYTGSSSYETAPRLVNGLRERLPDVEVFTRLIPRGDLLGAMAHGDLDLAIVRCPPALQGLESTLLKAEDQGVLAHADHPVFAHDGVALADVGEHPVLLHPRTANPEHYDLVMAWCRAGGFEPQVRERVLAFDATNSELVDGDAVAIVGPMTTAVSERLVWRPLVPALTLPICLLWRAQVASPLLRQIIGAAQEVARALDWI
jgi:DNA-binding transcriptional LysR family regulator